MIPLKYHQVDDLAGSLHGGVTCRLDVLYNLKGRLEAANGLVKLCDAQQRFRLEVFASNQFADLGRKELNIEFYQAWSQASLDMHRLNIKVIRASGQNLLAHLQCETLLPEIEHSPGEAFPRSVVGEALPLAQEGLQAARCA